MKRIALEEHFFTKDYLEYLRSRTDFPRQELTVDKNNRRIELERMAPSCSFTIDDPGPAAALLTDMGKGRIANMDKAGISMQVLSLKVPGVEAFDASEGITWARQTNDELARVVNRHPDRFSGLAALPLQKPTAAADELDRAVSKLGLRGALVNSHVKGEYLDNKKYWPVFEKAEELRVPIYLHPREPSPDMRKPYMGYPQLWGSMFGFGAEVSLHAMRLICSGVFDEYPHLKIVLGHMGETLPFSLWRLDERWGKTIMPGKPRKKPSEYIKDNFLVTTSGMFSLPALMCTYLALGADNILFAVDYPFESSELAVRFIESAPICDSDKEKICHLNAEQLLGL